MSAEGPLVSVVIPTRNRPGYLSAALASVRRQTYANLEILVRDNAGDPRSADLVARHRDPRVKYHRNESEVSACANFLDGVRASQGEYVTKLDDDDLWSPGFVAALVGPLEADPTLTAAFCDHWIMDSHGRIDPRASDRCTRRYGRDRLPTGR